MVRDAINHLENLDDLSFARGGGGAIQSLGITSPGDWAGEATKLGALIREEIKNNIKTYSLLGTELSKFSVAHTDHFLLASALCNIAAINMFTKVILKKDDVT